MYDICGKRTDGKVLNCPFGSPAVKVLVGIVYCSQCQLCTTGARLPVLLVLQLPLLLLFSWFDVFVYVFHFILYWLLVDPSFRSRVGTSLPYFWFCWFQVFFFLKHLKAVVTWGLHIVMLTSQMSCFHQRSKVYVPQLRAMFVVQKHSLTPYGPKSSK